MRCCYLLIVAMLVGVPNARAQTLEDYDYENLTFRGVGFDLGRVWPNKVDATSTYGVRLDLGYLGPGVRIAPSITFWSSELKTHELDRLAEQLNRLPALQDRGVAITREDLAPIEWSSLAVNVDGQFVWVTDIGLFTYLGAGLGLHALNGQGESIDDTFVEDLLDSITPALAVLGGVEYQPIDRFRIFAEARYTVLTDIHYPGVRIGGALMLPPRGSGTGTGWPGDAGGAR